MITPILMFEETKPDGNVLLTAKLTIYSQCMIAPQELNSSAIDHKKHKIDHLVRIIDQDFVKLKGMGNLIRVKNDLITKIYKPSSNHRYDACKPIVNEIEQLIHRLENIQYDIQMVHKEQ